MKPTSESALDPDTAVISCRGLSKAYREAGRDLPVLQGIDLEVLPGEKLAILGVSGSGKSTLLNMLGGLDAVTGGEVSVCGRSLTAMNESDIARWRNRHLGFVYQFHHLLGEFSALENVAMPLLIARQNAAEAKKAAALMLDKVGLSHRLEHRPSALSGGERQRVAIARALVAQPSCVLMDEPTGNLDPATAEEVFRLLLDLNSQLGISLVLVTHDHRIAHQMDRALTLQDGTLSEFIP